jgi:CRP-like cAMP-binding protein
MVSPELIRRYPYFSGLSIEKINLLANIAEEIEVERDQYFHHEGDGIETVYIIVKGEVSLITSLPQQDKEVVINTLGTGDVFGWTSLLPPFGYMMMQKIAQVIRDRLDSVVIETLAYQAGQ